MIYDILYLTCNINYITYHYVVYCIWYTIYYVSSHIIMNNIYIYTHMYADAHLVWNFNWRLCQVFLSCGIRSSLLQRRPGLDPTCAWTTSILASLVGRWLNWMVQWRNTKRLGCLSCLSCLDDLLMGFNFMSIIFMAIFTYFMFNPRIPRRCDMTDHVADRIADRVSLWCMTALPR